MKNAWALVRCVAAFLLLVGLLFVMVQTSRDGRISGVGVLGGLSSMAFALFFVQCAARRYVNWRAEKSRKSQKVNSE